jgi:hypothetical protein
MRRIIAALETSVDGFIAGPKGELDWAMAEDEETWKNLFEMLESADTCILGRVMYPEYEQYWLAVLADPAGILPLSGRPATKNENHLRTLGRQDAPCRPFQNAGQGGMEGNPNRARRGGNSKIEAPTGKGHLRRRWRHAGGQSHECGPGR